MRKLNMDTKLDSISTVSQLLAKHYAKKFESYGETPEGVDWGKDEEDHNLRLDRMLAVLELGCVEGAKPSLLDVGCGYGSLLELIKYRELPLQYCGIDICESMIESARSRHEDSEWMAGDIFDISGARCYDYVVCNGVLTQKLDVSIRDMDRFLLALVQKMFDLCRVGIAFNVMSTHVNFMAPNLYYKNPAELISWCMSVLTPRIRLDHAYPMYEYTVYLYREDAAGLVYGEHRKRSF